MKQNYWLALQDERAWDRAETLAAAEKRHKAGERVLSPREEATLMADELERVSQLYEQNVSLCLTPVLLHSYGLQLSLPFTLL